MRVSAIIPAYNEAQRIEAVVQATQPYVDEVLVMDDGSTDGTGEVAERAGARVIFQANGRYLAAVKHGFLQARGQIVVTLDADGEHCPRDIPRLIAPFLANEDDLVLGARSHVPRFSERLLNWLTRLRVKHVSDTGHRLPSDAARPGYKTGTARALHLRHLRVGGGGPGRAGRRDTRGFKPYRQIAAYRLVPRATGMACRALVVVAWPGWLGETRTKKPLGTQIRGVMFSGRAISATIILEQPRCAKCRVGSHAWS